MLAPCCLWGVAIQIILWIVSQTTLAITIFVINTTVYAKQIQSTANTQNTINIQTPANTNQIATDTQNSTNSTAQASATTNQPITDTQDTANSTLPVVNTQNTTNTQVATNPTPVTVSAQNKTNIQVTTNSPSANINTQNTIPPPAADPCLSFNNIAMQFSLIQPGMQSPINLEQLKTLFGNQKPTSTSVIINYTWIHKNRILVVTTTNNNLTNKLLTGTDDGSIGSKKMEQIYETLKTAISIWKIKDIRSKLGQENNSKTYLHTNYTWSCGNGRLQISVDENNTIKSADITYTTNQDPATIESQVGGTGHTPWDSATDSVTQHQRGWKRTFI